MIDKNKKTVEAYDKNPQFYAERFDSYGVSTADIDRAIKLNESGSDKVLELGCGNGRDAEYIVSRVGKANYTGLDASVGLLNEAKARNPGVDFRLADAREMDVIHETFGIIFAFSFFVHMNMEEMASIIDKCHKILKPGGVLCIFSSKYGDYQEKLTTNLGDEKYYYFYKPEDIEKLCPYRFFVVYKDIQDIKSQPKFEIILRKI
jgi:ubiquinone/menaquinone biosynthesis C-methylase UbiE